MRTDEAKFVRVMRKLLADQRQRIIAEVESGQFAIGDMFWHNEEMAMYEAILPLANDAFLAAATRATDLAFTQKQTGDIGEMIGRIVRRASAYVSELVASVTRTTRQTVGRVMVDYMAANEASRPAIIARLTPLFGESRAQTIAVTELTRFQMRGAAESAETLRSHGHDVVLVWVTDNDELVCPVCEPRHMREQGDGWESPEPAHVNCRCDIIERVR